MATAPTWAELQKLPDEELIGVYDDAAPTTQVWLGFAREELHRRQMERQGRTLTRLTWVITALTAANVVLAGVAVALVAGSD